MAMLLPGAAGAQQQPAPAPPPPQQAQPAPKPAESLAEAARKAREQKKKEAKPSKVFTNDDVGSAGASAAATTPSAGGTPTAEATPAAGAAAGAEGGEKKDEAYFRKKFAELRAKLAQDQKELDVLQRELNNTMMQYYDDPNKALVQQYSRSDIDALRQKIEDKKKEIAQDQQAIADLEDELRRVGGNPGWSR